MKTTKSIVALTLLTFISIVSYAQTSNFSGTWNRSTEQTNSGNLSINSVPLKLEVKQEKSSMNITRSGKTGTGESVGYPETLFFNGRVSEAKPKPGLVKKSTLKWSDDKKGFAETAEYFDEQNKLVQKLTESWSLSADGKVLTISSVLVANDETNQMEAVFDKK